MRYILFFLIILFVSFSDMFLHNIGIIPLSPAYFLVPLFFICSVITYHVRNYAKYLKTHTFGFLLLIVILSILYGVNDTVSIESIQQSIVLSLITLLLYSFCLILFVKSNPKETGFFILIGLTVMGASIWYDMFIGLPFTDLKLIGSARKGGFAENPNVAASAVKFLGLGLLLLYREKKTMRTIILVLTISSVFLTFSRSGLLSIFMAMVLLILNEWKIYFNLKMSHFFKVTIKMVIIFGVFFMLLLVFADIIKEEVPAFREGEAAERLDLLTGKSKAGVISKDDEGSHGRQGLVLSYLNVFYTNPFGIGTGYCSDKTLNLKNTHNYYLRVAVEFGIIGLFILGGYLFKSIKLAITKNNYYYFVFIILILFECMISHFLFQEKPLVVILALMDANLYFNAEKDSEESQIV
jgi:hypothetical protein